MSSYKIIDSTVSVLYCARCANEHLEQESPGRLVCPDCSAVIEYDPNVLRVGRLTGTKYKMRSTRKWSFREIVDEAREDAFREKFVPSPEPGRGKVGWRQKLDETDSDLEVRIAGADEPPATGWRNGEVMDMLTEQEDEDDSERTDGTFCGPG